MRRFEGYNKGINLGGWLSQCVARTKEHFDTFITEEDIKIIASWGLDHVRLPLDYDIVLSDNNEYIEEGFGYIDNCIKWCQNNGLNLILDLHKTYGYSFDPLEDTDKEAFFTDEKLIQHFIGFWQELAKRYGKYSDMMAFELLNEIISPNVTDEWNDIANRTIKGIREYAPDTYVVYGGVNYNNVSSVQKLSDPYDDKIVYNFHCYDPMVFTHQSAYWVVGMPSDFKMNYPAPLAECKEKGKMVSLELNATMGIELDDMDMVGPKFFEAIFKSAIDSAQKRNAPLYCGEYGVIDQAPTPDTVRWFKDINATFEKFGIGRACWTYKNKDFGLVDEHYAEIKDELIKLL